MKLAAVYIMAARNGGGCLHLDVTADLPTRLWAHQHARPDHWIKGLPDHKLVYYEFTADLYTAIVRLRDITRGPTGSRGELIRALNPDWHDLSDRVHALAKNPPQQHNMRRG